MYPQKIPPDLEPGYYRAHNLKASAVATEIWLPSPHGLIPFRLSRWLLFRVRVLMGRSESFGLFRRSENSRVVSAREAVITRLSCLLLFRGGAELLMRKDLLEIGRGGGL
ncbi:hypothetical protein TNCT_92431 [Trichonephila clavata]|uniref:Uncharacterized protein n=1 Tax=Trichonephila clavata TaxID=2740835 RepID=A0A8X6H3C4_TRICU|nr:hypothetical protein TNCT_92431 [Trichonephila clavata]